MLPMPFSNPTTYPGHTGIDFGQSRGTSIPASGNGVVSALSYTARAGYVTWVRYDAYSDREAGYAHQDSADRPAIGTRVSAGSWLGYVGSTGTNSTGPHLHLEIDPGATGDAVWAMFDSGSVVGGGSGSGGGATPDFPSLSLYGEAWVVEAQKKLIRLGYDLGADGADGKDGTKTQAATKALQQRGGLEADGVFGPATNAYADTLLAPASLAANQRRSDGDGVKGRADATTAAAQITYLEPNEIGDFNGWKRGQSVEGEDRWLRGAYSGAWFWLGGLSPRNTDGLADLNATAPAPPVTPPVTPPKVKYPQPSAPTYPGATKWAHSPSSEPRNGQKVKWFIIHHRGDKSLPTTAQWWDADMRDRGDAGVSPTWAVGSDGSVSEMVPPDTFRPWASGKADFNAVAVETQNVSAAPAWGISDASHEAIANLVAWAAKRYDFPIDREHVFGDREITAKTGIQTRATECPGPSMDLDRIVRRALELTSPPPQNDMIPVDKGWLSAILDKLKQILGK